MVPRRLRALSEGGVLEHVTRELNMEALPTSIPESIVYDVSAMEIGETVTLESVQPPHGVSLLDDLETVVAILSPPRLQTEAEPEIESETGLVGERLRGSLTKATPPGRSSRCALFRGSPAPQPSIG